MTTNELLDVLHNQVLRRINYSQPRASILRAIREGLDAAVPNWRSVVAADGLMQNFKFTLVRKGFANVDLILWSRAEKGRA